MQSLPLELWLLVSSAVSTMWCRSISCCVDAALRCRVFTFRLSVLIDTPPLLYPAQQIASHVSEPNSVDSSDQCDSLAALLALSTVSRSWRSLVLSPSCERLWLVAIETARLPELEAGPPKLVQYANLVVGRQCKVRFGALRRLELGTRCSSSGVLTPARMRAHADVHGPSRTQSRIPPPNPPLLQMLGRRVRLAS